MISIVSKPAAPKASVSRPKRVVYNRTAFTSSSVSNKVLDAMRDALDTGLSQYVQNRHGERWLRVAIKQAPKDEGVWSEQFYFEFYADNSQLCNDVIADAAWFGWGIVEVGLYETMQLEVARLIRHPLETLEAKKASAFRKRKMKEAHAERVIKANSKRIVDTAREQREAKACGATHIVRIGESGRSLLVSFKKRWWGLRGTTATVYKPDGSKYTLEAESVAFIHITGVL